MPVSVIIAYRSRLPKIGNSDLTASIHERKPIGHQRRLRLRAPGVRTGGTPGQDLAGRAGAAASALGSRHFAIGRSRRRAYRKRLGPIEDDPALNFGPSILGPAGEDLEIGQDLGFGR
jgi:hypothetical protein